MVTLKDVYKNTLVVNVGHEELIVTYDSTFRIIRIDGGGHRTITPRINDEIQRLVYRQA